MPKFPEGCEIILMYDFCQIAIRVLTLPSSAALCERVFYQLKFIHIARRSCLKPDIMDSMMNIRFKMKFNHEYFYDSDESDQDDESE